MIGEWSQLCGRKLRPFSRCVRYRRTFDSFRLRTRYGATAFSTQDSVLGAF
jgi:hypothetical protein